ncbi:DNA/RNA helicase domain-containing protein [Rubritalea spongiae]|uniref:DNA/RNA helicase domain-containing protein n=1 Tax=Rubritalea spongiae TaxID=430797 RepID=A0ABW5E4N9_9BACT
MTQMKRGSERIGLVASAGAKRLVPHGIQMKVSVEPDKWFLGPDHDIRSSNFLELAASQFDIQGLEIDWAVVCWDGDLRHIDNEWEHHKFKGSSWQRVNKLEERLYLRNAYRVLLTRARQGMVIFVPEGCETDVTRNPNFYEGTYNYLKSCGLRDLNL